jgi:hypothetical protein
MGRLAYNLNFTQPYESKEPPEWEVFFYLISGLILLLASFSISSNHENQI